MDNCNVSFPPQMRNVFNKLSTGYHLCIEDGELYEDLTKNEAFYREMFSTMGFNLSDGRDSLYYFLPSEEKINELSKKFMVFVSIMYDWLADQGKESVSALTEGHFFIDDLPHLSIDQYKKTMAQLDITDAAALMKIVQGLNRYGFLVMVDDNMIKFRKTIIRFVSILSEVADNQEEKEVEENK